jgi:hypothetical protein
MQQRAPCLDPCGRMGRSCRHADDKDRLVRHIHTGKSSPTPFEERLQHRAVAAQRRGANIWHEQQPKWRSAHRLTILEYGRGGRMHMPPALALDRCDRSDPGMFEGTHAHGLLKAAGYCGQQPIAGEEQGDVALAGRITPRFRRFAVPYRTPPRSNRSRCRAREELVSSGSERPQTDVAAHQRAESDQLIPDEACSPNPGEQLRGGCDAPVTEHDGQDLARHARAAREQVERCPSRWADAHTTPRRR